MLGKGNLKRILALVPRRERYPGNSPALFLLALLPLLLPTKSFAQWTHEPPGSTTILDCPFDDYPPACKINDVYSSTYKTTDPSAPISPPGVIYDNLAPYAKEGGSMMSYLFGNNYNEAYMGMMVRTNPEFEGRTVANKMAFLRGPDSNGLLALASESRLQPGGAVFFMHNTGGLDNSHTCAADLGLICYTNAGSGYLTKGQWTKIEFYVKKSTTNTSRDGIVRWWVNGQLAGNYENMNYAAAGLNEWVWTETWDGAGDMGTSNTVTWNWFFDHLYLSIPNCPDGCKNSGWATDHPNVPRTSDVPPGGPPGTLPQKTPKQASDEFVAKVSSKVPLDPSIIYLHLEDVGDFKPHFGFLPIPWPLPFAVVVPQGIGRGLWCYGPLMVCISGICSCIPLPFNWCEDFAECFATNTLNLISTLHIKYAWPEGEGRLDAPPNAKYVMPPDYYTRDMCVTSAKLDYSRFDPKTGKLIVPKVPGTIINADSSGFDERATGTVIGSRPIINSCMTTIDKPKFDPPTTGSSVFSYYMNAANYPFVSTSGDDTKTRNTVYGTSNNYLSTTFFIGSQLGCPERISNMAGGQAVSGEAWLDAANRCYSWFIYQRASHPEWTLERPGSGADFPLTQDEGRGGNPDLSIFNTCQPLMSGHNARLVAKGETPIGKGFAPVLQYDRADLDEADYSPAQELVQGFGDYFKGETPPSFHNLFPCLIKPEDAGPNKTTDWADFNGDLLMYYAISFSVEVSVLELDWGPMYFIPMSTRDDYKSVGRSKPGFCPNVEKIIDPTLPFAPRNDYINPRDHQDAAGNFDYPGEFAREIELLKDATFDQFSISPPNTAQYATDREYSFQTNVFTPRDRIFHDWGYAYSDFNPTMTNPITADPAVRLESLKYPEVQCGVVPVDIMAWRRNAFDNCIMQRINFNFVTYRRRNFLSYYYKNTLKPWKKPCVTRFWEHDSYDECPVSMSIQQCCRIIVKDVVPLNYLKIRTCEGLRQKRNFIFGFDHLYDYAETPTDATTTNSSGATVNAGGGLPIESIGGKAVRFPVPGEKITGSDLIFQAAPSNFSTIVFDNVSFSDDDKKQAKEAYNQLYIENQKLSLIGCDDSEPETFRFDNYFLHSDLKTIPSNAISEAMYELKEASDKIITEAKDQSMQGVLAVFGPNSVVWQAFTDAKKASDDIIANAREALQLVIDIETTARIRYENAERNASFLFSPDELSLIALGILPADLPISVGDEYLTSYAELQAAIAGTNVAASIYYQLKDTQEQVVQYAEIQIKNSVTQMLALEESFAMANAKAFADQTVIDGAAVIKSSLGPQFATIVDQTINLAMSNPVSQLAMQELGEGGAHMPYMRWWDTGTSAGNPMRGGSFINTLGSYDTIVGVGHEERDFNDATIPVPDIQEEYDPQEVANAQALVSSIQAELTLRKDELFNQLDGWNNSSGTGVAGTPIWFGVPDDDTILHSADKHVGVSDICYLTPKQPDGTYIDCSQFNQEFPPMQENIYKLRIALKNAQRKLDIANGVIVQDTTAKPVELTFEQSLINTSKMGRINGWDGLKGHQMWTLRRQNFSCIGRFEKIFKPYGPENFVLTRAGANWENKNGVQWSWPLGWRGYISDPDNEFEQHIFATGLDNAKIGDIIILNINGLKRIYYVSFVNDSDPRYIKTEGWDQGKFPTSTGSGISLGAGVERIIYKNPGDLPKAALQFRPPNTPNSVDISTIADAAKVNGVPSCEDPDYTNCVLGGEGADVDGQFIPNDTWDDVKIYRPSEDTDRRQCPMFNSGKVGGANVKLDTSELASDSIAYCINAGFDPPPYYTSMPFNGTGAGNLSDTTLCGLKWGDCSSYIRARKSCFPGNESCVANTTDVPTPPDQLPPGKVDCTDEQLKEAADAYSKDIASLTTVNTQVKDDLKAAQKKLNDLTTQYNQLLAQSNLDISSQQSSAAANQANSQISNLNTQLATANSQLNAANNMTIPAPIIAVDPVTNAQTVTNQSQIDAATQAKQSAINAANSSITTINGEIAAQQKIVNSAGNVSTANSNLATLQAEAQAAWQDLDNYIAAHQNDVPPDVEQLTPQQQQTQLDIANNTTLLRDKANAAQQKVNSAISKLKSTQTALNTLVPSNTQSQQSAYDQQLADLQAQIDAANLEVQAAQDAVLDAGTGAPVLPKFSCPYTSLSGDVFGGPAANAGP